MSNYNNTITTLTKSQNLIESRLNYFEDNLQKIHDDFTAYLRAQNTIQKFLDNLENSVKFAKLNTIHNSVVSAYQMEKIIETVIILYGKEKIPKFKNLLSYYKLISTDVTFYDCKLMFKAANFLESGNTRN